MMHILRRLPFFDEETTAAVAGATATVRAYQIVAWVSIAPWETTELPADTLRFPAVIDTANNHNFSIREEHLAWAGLTSSAIRRHGQVHIGNQTVPLLAANVWLHRNKPGERDTFAKGKPISLELPEGIIVYPGGVPNVARLPTLGLRALVSNRLHLTIDGAALLVSLRTQAAKRQS